MSHYLVYCTISHRFVGRFRAYDTVDLWWLIDSREDASTCIFATASSGWAADMKWYRFPVIATGTPPENAADFKPERVAARDLPPGLRDA